MSLGHSFGTPYQLDDLLDSEQTLHYLGSHCHPVVTPSHNIVYLQLRDDQRFTLRSLPEAFRLIAIEPDAAREQHGGRCGKS
jgi:hypothetical protein